MNKLQEIKKIMNEMSEYALLHYTKPITSLVIAEYKFMFLHYVRLYIELESEGAEIPEFEIISDLTDDEYSDMMDWTQKIVSICESSMTQNEKDGISEMN